MADAPGAPPPVPFVKLREWAMFALEDWANPRSHAAVLRSFELRFILAWLYSTNPGDRAAFDDFWREATRHVDVRGGAYETAIADRRRRLRRALAGIYRAIGVYGPDVHARWQQAVATREVWYARREAERQAERCKP